MELKFKELEVLRAVMETGSVTAAARQLGVTQPAISKMLAQVERELGFACFDRLQGRLTPTSEGRALLPEIVKALAGVDTVVRFAEDLRTTRSGKVSVAAVPSVAVSLLPAAVEAFCRVRPDVAVSLTTSSNHEVVRQVAESKVDFGLILMPTADHELASRDLCSANLVCILPTGHPLACKAEIDVEDIAGVPLVSLERDKPVRLLAEQAFAAAGLRYSVAIEVTQSAAALAMIAAGAGIAVMDAFTLLEFRDTRVTSRPLRTPLKITCRMLWPRHRPLSRLSGALVETLDEVVRSRARAGMVDLPPQAVETSAPVGPKGRTLGVADLAPPPASLQP